MTFSVMLYGIVLGFLLGGAAYSMDRGLRAVGRPSRWIWVAALTGGTLVPLGSVLLPRGSEPKVPAGAVIPLETLYGMGDGTLSRGTGVASLIQALNGPLFMAWIGASALMVLLFVGATLALRRRSRVWPRERAGGEEVLISDGLGPAVLGLLRPRIVLPPWALSLGADELEMVLLHEAEHRKARDPALLAAGILMVTLAPWNPALWWCLRQLRLAVEGDCDGRVLARGVSRKRYGALLLGMASGARDVFHLAPALAEGGGTFLERRLRMMKKSVGKRGIGGAVAAVVAGGLLLALACETPTPPQANESAGDPGVLVELDDGSAVTEAELKLLKENSAPSRAEIGATGSLVLRPIREDDTQAQPLIFVDGVRMDGGKEAIADLNPDQIERIEVIKGGAAEAVFGVEATGGVIQIFLKKAGSG
ncbi:MAG: M56 family metallopeptidase [Longimicrobiales bacterium]